jgi:hypothetical protein
MGTKGRWNNLGYTVVTPAGTDVKFAVQTGPTPVGPWSPAVPVGPPQGALVADAPIDHPQTCTVSGPSPCGNKCGATSSSACPASCACPVPLSPPLSKVEAEQPVLQLNALLGMGTGGTCGGSVSPGLLTSPNGTHSSCSGGKDDFSATCNSDPYFMCQQDFHCDAAADACVWNVPSNYFDPSCKDGAGNPGVDLQIGAPCGTTVPLCNRGGGTLAAGTVVPFYNSFSGGSGKWDCVANPVAPGSSAGSYTLTAPLGPGACVNVPGINFSTGQRDLYVNPTKTITECGGGFSGSGGGCRNNSAHIKASGAGCPPTCGAPAVAPAVPKLVSWQVTYSCVPAE